jgi:hypothetical protein
MHSTEFRNTIVATFAASMMLWAGAKGRHFVAETAYPSGKANPSNDAFKIAAAVGPISLGSGATRFILVPAKGTKAEEPAFASRLSALPPGRHIYLVLRNLSAPEPPGVLYHVYLDLPEGAQPGKADPHHVGALNFFQAGRLTDSGAHVATPSEFRSFDVTAAGKTLQSRGLLGDPTTVTIIPGTPPSSEVKPTIGQIELVEQ